jgi:hypothetical protein
MLFISFENDKKTSQNDISPESCRIPPGIHLKYGKDSLPGSS